MSLLRWLFALLAGAIALPTQSGAQQASNTPTGPTRHVWTAEWKNDLEDPGRPYARHVTWRMSFTGVEEVSPDGTKRWLSRQWAWKLLDIYEQIGTIAYDPARGRYKINITKTCTGGATLDLGAADGPHATAGAPALKADCEEVVEPVDGQGQSSHRRLSENVNQMPTMRPPQEGCSVSEAQRHVQGDSVGTSSYSLTISPYVDAVMEVSTDGLYGGFVPMPGQRLQFTAHVRTPSKAYFRFELVRDQTSHFPGYATNANIDAAFFTKYDLGDVESAYGNDDPDEVFLPRDFEGDEWSWQDFAAVETRTLQNNATVTVTAMDFGAVGKLRGFVKVDECGGWQPIKIVVDGQRRDGIQVPLDTDSNLMADALSSYRDVSSGADADEEPEGNGVRGDGFTAFEEYRGFMIKGGDCRNRESDPHIRTEPDKKDLFVRTADPDFEMALPFAAAQLGLEIYSICAHQYSSDPPQNWMREGGRNCRVLPSAQVPSDRVVNYTMLNVRSWRGNRVSQEVPQHGLYVANSDLRWTDKVGIACTWTTGGTPGTTVFVLIDKARHAGFNEGEVARTLTHELAHSVGLSHHDPPSRPRTPADCLMVPYRLFYLAEVTDMPPLSICSRPHDGREACAKFLVINDQAMRGDQ